MSDLGMGDGRVFDDYIRVRRNPNGRTGTTGIPYVIWRKGGGFFSTLSSVLGHLRMAERLRLEPVVDFQNYPTFYNESEPIHGTMNAWEYYFAPVSSLSLSDAYDYPVLYLSSGKHPSDTVQSVSKDPDLLTYYEKYVKLNQPTSDYVASSMVDVGVSDRTLGVHFRGGEMRRAPFHPYPPTKRQMLGEISRAFETGLFENVLLVTEQKDYLDFFSKHLGSRLLVTDSFRAYRRNPYRINPRRNHRYLLGLEILRDVHLLSRCGGILSGNSNVSEMARLLNRGQYHLDSQIRNGHNSGRRVWSRVSWYLRAIAPSGAGGFH